MADKTPERRNIALVHLHRLDLDTQNEEQSNHRPGAWARLFFARIVDSTLMKELRRSWCRS